MTSSSENADAVETLATNLPSNGNHWLSAKGLSLLKEWGGVATVLIAILYTFPFDAASRYINWREQSLLEARKALSDVAALYAAATTALPTVQDLKARSFLASTYKVRIYNHLATNKESIAAAAHRNQLLPSELYVVGGFFTLAGLPEGLSYYRLALAKSSSDLEMVTIFSDLGTALFTVGQDQNIPAARDAFLKALTIASTTPYFLSSYLYQVNELSDFELMNGDWKCGQDLSKYGLSLLDSAAAENPTLQDSKTYFHNRAATIARKPSQPEMGCPYQIPLFPGNPTKTPSRSFHATPGPLAMQEPAKSEAAQSQLH